MFNSSTMTTISCNVSHLSAFAAKIYDITVDEVIQISFKLL